MPALLRTIEQIFGVQPFVAVRPAGDCRCTRRSCHADRQADLAPYTVAQELVPFALNSTDAPYAALSKSMNCWQTYDLCNEQELNKSSTPQRKLHPTPIPRR